MTFERPTPPTGDELAAMVNALLMACRMLASHAVASMDASTIEARKFLGQAVLGIAQIQVLTTIDDAPIVQVLAMDMAGQTREIMRFTAPAATAEPTSPGGGSNL